MASGFRSRRSLSSSPALGAGALLVFGLAGLGVGSPAAAQAPDPDPRVGLGAGLFDAEEAAWNLRVLSSTPPPEAFVGSWNSDLAFFGDYVVQGNFWGFMIWDISDPTRPEPVTAHVCPGAQGDVSVHGNLLFVSVEGPEARLDCGIEGVGEAASPDRISGIRIFDIANVRRPDYIGNVQTCRGSHTHTVLGDPADPDHVYVYISGVGPLRPAEELPGCVGEPEEEEGAASIHSRIEVIRVPLDAPERAEVVSTPPILEGLTQPHRHGPAPEDARAAEEARERGEFVVHIEVIGEQMILPREMTDPMLAGIVEARGGTGAPTAADSAQLRESLPAIVAGMLGDGPLTMCHDITLYPEAGLGAGACLGHGLLLDIRDPVNPSRLHTAVDSNFVAWHSATFNNDGTAVLFTDEWGGGTAPKCRGSDPPEWGANAIFSIRDGALHFESYYKLPAPQSPLENCVAHNGSLIPVPGRDVMVQGWYQGGISVFDWTDPANPFEIAFHDRGPNDAERLVPGGSWSAYWYNGFIVSSEMVRGLDILELQPSELLTENEIEAARSVRFEELNVQGQPRFVWPPSFSLARAYVDQLERTQGLPAERIREVRRELADAEAASGAARADALRDLAGRLDGEAGGSRDAAKVRRLAKAVRELAAAG